MGEVVVNLIRFPVRLALETLLTRYPGKGLPAKGFHKWGIPIAGWFIMENPTKMDDLGVPRYPHL